MKTFRVGIDSYSLFPGGFSPLETVKWAVENGAEGVAFSGFEESIRTTLTSSVLRDVRKFADDNGLYLEWGNGQHVPMELTAFTAKDIFSSNRRAIAEAYDLGVNIIRSCSGGLMRWKKDSPSTGFLLEMAAAELRKQSSLFRDYGMTLAIETHFEFTTFELVRLFEMCDAEPGGWLGICLDTMNLLTMLEEPVSATARVLPWIVSTHLKDGGILAGDDGMTTFPAELGTGIVNIDEILGMIASAGREINFSVEGHGGSFFIPLREKWFIERFPDLQADEYSLLLKLAIESGEKIKGAKLKITGREEWPEIYNERTLKDINSLKKVRDRILKNLKIY
jgi:sugar phosphate isomerase/epimerase